MARTVQFKQQLILLLTFLFSCRYHLTFSVRDRVWQQSAVSANVTVDVRLLSPDALAHAVPITISPITAIQLTKSWSPGVSIYINPLSFYLLHSKIC